MDVNERIRMYFPYPSLIRRARWRVREKEGRGSEKEREPGLENLLAKGLARRNDRVFIDVTITFLFI